MPHNEQHSFSPELNWKIRLVDETNGGVEIEKKDYGGFSITNGIHYKSAGNSRRLDFIFNEDS